MHRLLKVTAAALIGSLPWTAFGTGIPVFDASNLSQNIVTAFQSITQTLKQVQQYAQQVQAYQLQLQQYANQIKNTLAPAAYIWQEANKTVGDVMSTVNMFQGQGTQLQAYLKQFQSVDYWRNISPAAYPPQSAGSEAQKKANDALVQGIVRQQQRLQQDAVTLERLQSNAQSAQGQMQAIQAANQLAAAQIQQLMMIRALLIQEQQALAARMQTQANDEAMRQAATEKFMKWNYQSTAPTYYSPTQK